LRKAERLPAKENVTTELNAVSSPETRVNERNDGDISTVIVRAFGFDGRTDRFQIAKERP